MLLLKEVKVSQKIQLRRKIVDEIGIKQLYIVCFHEELSSQNWLTRSGIIASIHPNAMVYALGSGPILVEWECSLVSPYIPWVKARSSLSTCKRNNCPTTRPRERHCGGRRRKYCTPIRDTITKFKIHVHFLFHKGARDFVKLI